MYDQGSEGMFPFPIPISPQMPLKDQMSITSLNPGMNMGPLPSMDYNFSPEYKKGGHINSLQEIIEHIKSRGEDEDKILAYINPEEADELDERFGHDINPETGLPQYGFFKKFKKIFKKKGLKNLLPIAGALAGNYLAPGIGGVVGGGLGGAFGSKKNPLKGGLTGAAIGALQGYGLPALGRAATSSGMPFLGQGLELAGQSRFASALPALGQGLGLLSIPALQGVQGVASRGNPQDTPDLRKWYKKTGLGKALQNSIDELHGSAPNEQKQELGNLLNYLLLGLTAAGQLGGKTKYKIPGEYAKEPSLQEIMKSIRPAPRESDKGRVIPAYEPPRDLFKLPKITEENYEYPKFAKGGLLKFPGGGHVRYKGHKFHHGWVYLGNGKVSDGRHTRSINSYETKELNTLLKNDEAKEQAKKAREIAIRQQNERQKTLKRIGDLEKQNSQLLSSQNQPVETSTPSFQNQLSTLIQNVISHIPQSIHNTPKTNKDIPIGKQESMESPIVYTPRNIPAYEPPQDLFNVTSGMEQGFNYPSFGEGENPINYEIYSPGINTEQGFQGYPTFAKGGYVDGEDGGQDDNRRRSLPEGSYIVDATTVSLIGDGNSKAGKKKLDELLSKIPDYPEKFSKGNRVKPRKIEALISDGEYEIPPSKVNSFGKGDNDLGAKRIKKMINNIRKHKKVPHLPPKSKPLGSYIRI